MAQPINDAIIQLDDPKQRKAAGDFLLGKGADSVEPLIARLDSTDDSGLRGTIIGLLTKLKDVRATISLRKLTYDADPSIHGRAVIALAALDPSGSVEDIKRVALEPVNGNYDSQLVRLLGEMGYQADAFHVVETMIAENRKSLDATVYALSQFADPSMYDLFLGMLDHPSAAVVSSAMAGLTRLADERVINRFIAMLKDPRPIIRVTAAKDLAQIGDARAIEPIKALFNDQELSGTGDYREGPLPTVAVMAKLALKELRSRYLVWKIWYLIRAL